MQLKIKKNPNLGENDMFTHIDPFFSIPKLSSQNRDGFRYYSIDGKSYPSVTSALSLLSKESIRAWRDSIGHDVADFESRRAANRGTAFHKICEHYLCNKDISDFRKKVLPFSFFNFLNC